MKPFKLYILFFFTFSFSNILFSQQGQHSSGMEQPAINPENMVKIIRYDFDEVVKRLKLKDASKKTIVNTAITLHNDKVNEIKVFNYEQFNSVKKFLTKKRDEAKLSNDFRVLKEAKIRATEMLAPISIKVKEQQTILNQSLKKELSEKKYKKWLKYQQGKLKKLKPKAPSKPQMQRGNQRQGMGMGRRRY